MRALGWNFELLGMDKWYLKILFSGIKNIDLITFIHFRLLFEVVTDNNVGHVYVKSEDGELFVVNDMGDVVKDHFHYPIEKNFYEIDWKRITNWQMSCFIEISKKNVKNFETKLKVVKKASK
jgi:hypothetical protein